VRIDKETGLMPAVRAEVRLIYSFLWRASRRKNSITTRSAGNFN